MKSNRLSIFRTLILLFVSAFSFAMAMISCDKDNNGVDNIPAAAVVEDAEGKYFVTFYPEGRTKEAVKFTIGKELNAKEIDLSQPGNWIVSTTGFGGIGDQLPLRKGSKLFINVQANGMIEIRYDMMQADINNSRHLKGTYLGKLEKR